MEKGHWLPSLRILTNLARHLDVPVQYFINGSTQPEYHPHQLTLELRHLGIIDLDISQAIVPGAFRGREEILILSLVGERLDPRVVEAIPYVMLKHQWQIDLMVGFARKHDRRAVYRAAWLAEIALVLQERLHFPCGSRTVKSLNRLIKRARKPDIPDSLGLPSLQPARLPAYYKRWNITYAASLSDFSKRGESLHALAKQRHRSTLRTVSK